MTVSEHVAAIKSAAQELDRLKDDLVKEHGDRIMSIIRRYAKSTGQGCRDDTDPDWKINYYENEVSVNWEEFWSRGGHERGGFSFPLEMITDDGSSISTFEANKASDNATREHHARIIQEQNDREQLAALKRKYES